MKNPFSRIALAALFAALTATLSAAPALLGNPGLKGQALDAEAVKAVLLGKRVAIGDARVVIVIAKDSATQESFLQAHVGMTTSQFQNHWRRLFMTGGGSAPKVVENEAEAVKVAAETAGAVVVADPANAANLAVLAAN